MKDLESNRAHGVKAIAALVLAARQSTRMSGINKVLARMPEGRKLIRHTVAHVTATSARPVIVVTG